MTVETIRATVPNNLLLITGTRYPTPSEAAGLEPVAASPECVCVLTNPADEGGTIVRVTDRDSLDDLPSTGDLRWAGRLDLPDGRLRLTDIASKALLEWPFDLGGSARIEIWSDTIERPRHLVVVVSE